MVNLFIPCLPPHAVTAIMKSTCLLKPSTTSYHPSPPLLPFPFPPGSHRALLLLPAARLWLLSCSWLPLAFLASSCLLGFDSGSGTPGISLRGALTFFQLPLSGVFPGVWIQALTWEPPGHIRSTISPTPEFGALTTKLSTQPALKLFPSLWELRQKLVVSLDFSFFVSIGNPQPKSVASTFRIHPER